MVSGRRPTAWPRQRVEHLVTWQSLVFPNVTAGAICCHPHAIGANVISCLGRGWLCQYFSSAFSRGWADGRTPDLDSPVGGGQIGGRLLNEKWLLVNLPQHRAAACLLAFACAVPSAWHALCIFWGQIPTVLRDLAWARWAPKALSGMVGRGAYYE